MGGPVLEREGAGVDHFPLGEIATAPDTIEYTYTSELFCGEVLSCVENGKVAGPRFSGAAHGAEGQWLGTQTWTVQCCAARYAPPRGQ